VTHAVKIAISLPAELVAAAERERTAKHQSRSEFIRQAIEAYLQAQREREADARYVAGYRDHPETPEEIADATALAVLAFDPEAWA
jgi:metal-responsive CopG/Arc/MetJ family transcriptional regulator